MQAVLVCSVYDQFMMLDSAERLSIIDETQHYVLSLIVAVLNPYLSRN